MDKAVMNDKISDPEGGHPKPSRDTEVRRDRGRRLKAVDDQPDREGCVKDREDIIELKPPRPRRVM